MGIKVGAYTKRNRMESGNNSQSKQYGVLNDTRRVYDLLKENREMSFTASKIAEECGIVNLSNLKPKVLFLVKLRLVVRYKPNSYKGVSNSVWYYKFNK